MRLTPLTPKAIDLLNDLIIIKEKFFPTMDQTENPRLEKESRFSRDLFREDYFVNETSFYDYVLALSDEEFIRVAQLSRFDEKTCQKPVLDYLHEIKKCSDAQLKKEKILDLLDPGPKNPLLGKILSESRESQKNKDNQPDPFYISLHSVIRNWIQSSLDIKTDSEKLITPLISAYRQELLALIRGVPLLSKRLSDIFQDKIYIDSKKERSGRFSKTKNNEIDFTVTISPLIHSPPVVDGSDSGIKCILGKLEYTLRFDSENNRFKLTQCKTTGGFLEKMMSGDYENETGTEEELKNTIYHDLLIAYHQYHDDKSHEQFNFHKTLADKIGVPADFSGLDLSGLDLSGLDLSGLDFSNANLTHVNFTNANLTNVNFTRANLTNTNFFGAKLQGAKIANKKSRENFMLPENADYENTDLRGVDLSKVQNIAQVKSLKGARLDKKQVEFLVKNRLYLSHLLTETDLRGVDYQEPLDLSQIDLSGITVDQHTGLHLTNHQLDEDAREYTRQHGIKIAAPCDGNNNFNYVFGSGAKIKILQNNDTAWELQKLYNKLPYSSLSVLAHQNLYEVLKNSIKGNLDDKTFNQLIRAHYELNTPLDLSGLNLTDINLCEYDLSKVDFKNTKFNESINVCKVGLHNLRALARDGILTKKTKITLGESKNYTIEELVSAFCKAYNEERNIEIKIGCTPRFFAEKLKSDFVHSELKKGDEFVVENLIKILEHARQKSKSRTAQVLKQIPDSGSLSPEPPTSSRDSLKS